MKAFELCLLGSLVACGNSSLPAADASVDGITVADTTIIVPDGGTRALGPNDISILFPLGRGELWPATTTLLTQARFAEINATRFPSLGTRTREGRGIFPNLDGEAAEFASLRVVALRIEPCASGCAGQIRFVLQSGDAATFRDGAVHVVHNLDRAQFTALQSRMAGLQFVSPENVDPVLKVNPSLAAQGLDGAYGSALRQSMMSTVSDATLHRVTFMSRSDADQALWEFGGLDFNGGVVTGTTSMTGFPSTRLQVLLAPVGAMYELRLDTDRTIVSHSDIAFEPAVHVIQLSTRPMAEQQSAYDAIARRHNPSALTPDTTDCVGCHISSPVRSQPFFRNFTSTMAYGAEASSRRVSGPIDENVDNMRMFGYFETMPVVSQRVANDTHFSLTMWNP